MRTRRGQLTKPEDGQQLTDMQAAFVEAFVRNGGKAGEAALEAGYAKTAAQTRASEMLTLPHVSAAVYRACHSRFGQRAPEMMRVIEELARSSKSAMVRLLAAQDWLDRAGFRPREEHIHLLAGEMKVSIDLGLEGGAPKLVDNRVSEESPP